MTQLQTTFRPQESALFIQQRAGLVQSILYIGLAGFALLAHFILGAAFGLLGYLWIGALTVIALMVNAEFVCVILLLCLFLQNAFIGLVMPAIDDPSKFAVLQGSSFIVTLIIAMACTGFWVKFRNRLHKDNKTLLVRLGFFLLVILLYTAYGAANSTVMDALVYARVYLIGGLLLIAGVALGLQLSLRSFVDLVRIMAFILVLWAVMEFCFTRELYQLFNILEYYNIKFTSQFDAQGFNSIAELIDYRNSSYFNLSGSLGLDIRILRLSGPNIHPITYAYALAFCGLVCFIYRMPVLTLGCFLALLMIGAKGPFLMLIFAVLLYYFYRMTRSRIWLLLALATVLALYFIIGIVYGLYTEDYHVVGFMGGVTGFLHNPIGHGIGVGGNLSKLAVQQSNFNLFQGYGADFALESAFGVMLYQIGIGAAVFILFFWTVWKAVWKAAQSYVTEPRLIVLPVALGFLFINGVFQEEALSPSGWGLWLLFSGFLLARYWKATGAAPKMV